MGDKTLAEGDKSDLVLYTDSNGIEYLSVTLDGVGANDFGTEITYTGSYMPEGAFTVDSLIDRAEEAWKNDAEAYNLAVALN